MTPVGVSKQAADYADERNHRHQCICAHHVRDAFYVASRRMPCHCCKPSYRGRPRKQKKTLKMPEPIWRPSICWACRIMIFIPVWLAQVGRRRARSFALLDLYDREMYAMLSTVAMINSICTPHKRVGWSHYMQHFVLEQCCLSGTFYNGAHSQVYKSCTQCSGLG